MLVYLGVYLYGPQRLLLDLQYMLVNHILPLLLTTLERGQQLHL